MTAELNRWAIENISSVVFVLAMALVGAHFEIKRLNKRCDSMLILLKRRGIDLSDS